MSFGTYMIRYILKRILQLIPVVILVSFLIFVIMDMASGDVVSSIAGEMTEAEQEFLRHQMGYDRGVLYRFWLYFKDLLHGNLGTSLVMGEPVWKLFISRFPNTLVLAFASCVVCYVLSIPLGIFSAIKQGTLWDNSCTVLALLGLSIPNFWLGLLLIIAFSLKLGWFPSMDFKGFSSIILPAFTIGTGMMAILTRTTRSSMVDVLRQDYLRTLRSKGVPENKVITKHAFKNALIPIITIAGQQFAECLGGSVLTETVFTWPGVGRLTINAINSRDTVLATGCILMTTLFHCLVVLVVDILYAYVDPRIKGQYVRGPKRRKTNESK